MIIWDATRKTFGAEIKVLKRYLLSHVHCSPVHNGQLGETTQVVTDE